MSPAAPRGLPSLAKKIAERHFWRRRQCLGGLLAVLSGALLGARQTLAAEWLSAAFTARKIDQALKAYGTPKPSPHPDVHILADDYSERGENVRFVLYSTIPGSEEMAVFADHNRFPLAASFRFMNGALPAVALQLKLAETTDVRVLIRTAEQRVFSARKKISITVSGCN